MAAAAREPMKHNNHTIHQCHFGWSNANEPVVKIAPGESIEFRPLDSSGGQINATSTLEDLGTLDFGKVNPVAGPVYVDGAEPGDAIKVTLLAFTPSGWGWTANIPGFGLLADQFPAAALHHWSYDASLAPAMYGPGGRVPLKPFTGTIGVAPAASGLHSIIPPRNVGGNMDVRDIAEGTELWLPIEVSGALFSVGDTHAA
jgi:acetamidase/formamidase